jgi:lysophospholipase L1-like esterase
MTIFKWENALVLEAGRHVWRSAPFPVMPGRFYRISYEGRSPAGKAYLAFVGVHRSIDWGRELGSEHGALTATDFTSVETSAEWNGHVFFSQALPHSAEGFIRFETLDSVLEVRNLQVETADGPEVFRWVRSLLQRLPPAPYCRSEGTEAVRKRLAAGETLRVVMLGDSVMNDVGHAPWGPLLENAFPGAKVEVFFAVGASTGMREWNRPRDFPEKDLSWENAVLKPEPHLVLIGGMSNGGAEEDFGQVLERLRRDLPLAEIVLVTRPPLLSECLRYRTAQQWIEGVSVVREERRRLRRLAREHATGWIDGGRCWLERLLAARKAGVEPDDFFRDDYHVNALGRAVWAEIMAAGLQAPPASFLRQIWKGVVGR